MRPIDFKEERAVNPMDFPVLYAFSVFRTCSTVRNGLRATRDLLMENGLQIIYYYLI
jgi:hypothetical protein